MVEQTASFLNYFLMHLVGPKRRELRVSFPNVIHHGGKIVFHIYLNECWWRKNQAYLCKYNFFFYLRLWETPSSKRLYFLQIFLIVVLEIFCWFIGGKISFVRHSLYRVCQKLFVVWLDIKKNNDKMKSHMNEFSSKILQ